MMEILAPAGDESCAYAAINAGADAIYLGLSAFSARSSAANFDWQSLENLIARAHLFGVKIYVAMNTLVKNCELEEFVKSAVKAHNAGADALIIQDIYLGAYLKKLYPQMCLHLSTQAGINNVLGAQYAKELGFSRVVLARETTIADVEKISKVIETEAFIQGALCTCFSGQCYLSSFAGGNSGNRGKCKQPCRKQYKIDRRGFEEYAYRISLSDLCVGEDIKKLAQAGVSSFKIEGRMRRPEYVSATVDYYKKLLDGSACAAQFSALKRAYNRGNYTKGLAFGQDRSLISSAVQGHMGEYVGVISVESGKYICRTSARAGEGDGFKILRNGKELCGAAFGERVKGGFTLKCSVRLKNGDKAFITTDNSLSKNLSSVSRKYELKISAVFACGKRPVVTVNGRQYTADFDAEASCGSNFTAEDFKKCFNKTDIYPYQLVYGDISVVGDIFVPASLLNAFRREVYAQIMREHCPNGSAMCSQDISLPNPEPLQKNDKTAVIARSLRGVKADIGILKPNAYKGDLSPLLKGFTGEKFLYLPPRLTDGELEGVKGLLQPFDGIYCGGNYAVPLARALDKKLFAGAGFNLFNYVSVDMCPADYKVVSKELTVAEAKQLARFNTFYLTSGDIKVMDLIYCPFGKTCRDCDKRDFYILTDGDGRAFPLRRYETEGCRFELYNCAELKCQNAFTGALKVEVCPSGFYARNSKRGESGYTKGHSEKPVF